MDDTRRRAYRVIGSLAAGATVLAAIAMAHDTQSVAMASESCSTTVNLALPERPAQVELRVLNGTRRAGVADQVSRDFADRGFVTRKPAKNGSKVTDVAVVTYGPKAVGAAQWIRAYFLGEAEPRFDAKRTTGVIDVVIGTRYRQLATTTEVNQSLAQLGSPVAPPGTCPA
ncbi:LytR C-terminal domain-containing protein [Actinoplanes sp. NPDC051851]|uniref:LytR C-terminal domain-containing protein n=1 Tax=Actinoplanes sp. NPDC051851 TaxID=3154753 RepID=UPI00343B00F8